MKYIDINSANRSLWLKRVLASIPTGYSILDAGAGALANKKYCSHLLYHSQDFCQPFDGDSLGDANHIDDVKTNDLPPPIDFVCDISSIPEPSETYDVVLCSEVFEHLPDPLAALNELIRIIKPGGKLILTAPFASVVHLSPYFYYTGFSANWYSYHMKLRGMTIDELSANGDWFSLFRQESARLGSMSKRSGDILWPLAYLISILVHFFILLRNGKALNDVACFGFHCVATKVIKEKNK